MSNPGPDRRIITVGRIIQSNPGGGRSSVPLIRLSGNWLVLNGFSIGDRIELHVVDGELRITRLPNGTPDDLPECGDS